MRLLHRYWIFSFTLLLFIDGITWTHVWALKRITTDPFYRRVSVSFSGENEMDKTEMTLNILWVKTLPVTQHTMTMSEWRFVESERSMEPHLTFVATIEKRYEFVLFRYCLKSFSYELLAVHGPWSMHNNNKHAHRAFSKQKTCNRCAMHNTFSAFRFRNSISK